MTELAYIPIADIDDSAVVIEDWPTICSEPELLCLKLKHKGRYRSVLLDPFQLREVIEQLANAGIKKWGEEFAIALAAPKFLGGQDEIRSKDKR